MNMYSKILDKQGLGFLPSPLQSELIFFTRRACADNMVVDGCDVLLLDDNWNDIGFVLITGI